MTLSLTMICKADSKGVYVQLPQTRDTLNTMSLKPASVLALTAPVYCLAQPAVRWHCSQKLSGYALSSAGLQSRA